MTWARFEDRFPWHRKVRGLSDGAFRLHVSAVCWSCEHLTDGKVETDDLPLVSDVRRLAPAVEELERKGVWDVLPDGWQIHDFLTYNESRETVLARREADAERKRRGRENRKGKGSPGGVQPDSQQDSTTESQGESVRPVPTRPEPTTPNGVVTRKRAAAKTAAPDEFPLTAELRAWGQQHAPLVADPVAETRQFLDHHRAKGTTFKDWTAAWRTWMTNAQKFAAERGSVRPLRSVQVDRPDVPEVDEWRLTP